MSRDTVWQYSEDWQRQLGLFEPSETAPKTDPAEHVRASVVAPVEVAVWDVSPSGFVSAVDKLEAVNRLSRAAGGAGESLGPGSKERKSVLITVARALNLDPSVEGLSKPELGAALADVLGASWDEDCWSRGSTITLEGLNRLLECALVRSTPTRSDPETDTAPAEARRILDVCVRALPKQFEGESVVEEMFAAESRNWAQSEWPGFYFEHRGISACIRAMGGAPVASPGRTRFDYGLDYIWDFKCHSEGDPWAILNDQVAIEWAIEERGLGFIVLEGTAEENPAFGDWHREFKQDHGVQPRPRGADRGYVRRLKSSFTPSRLTAYRFDDHDSWAAATAAGAIREHRQGQQISGAPRKNKFKMNLHLASPWVLATEPLR